MRAPVLPDQDPATRTSLSLNQPLRVPVSRRPRRGPGRPAAAARRTVRTRLALPAMLPARAAARLLVFKSNAHVPRPRARPQMQRPDGGPQPRLPTAGVPGASASARCPQPSSSARCHLASSPDWGPWPGRAGVSCGSSASISLPPSPSLPPTSVAPRK